MIDAVIDTVIDAVKEVIALGFEPLGVEDQLASMAGIAGRTGRSRQSVPTLVGGRRGPEGLPRPVAGNVRSPLRHLADVVSWFGSSRGVSAPPAPG